MMGEGDGPRFVIAVPTYKRPDLLAHLLTAMATLERREEAMLIIADNDPVERQGLSVAHAFAAQDYPMPIDAFSVPEPGLAAVRNALVARALAVPSMRRLAMIDDDEWPMRHWLAQLVRLQQRTGAGVVGGPVIPHFERDAPRWASQTLVFRPEIRGEGATGMLWAGNNLLVTRRALERLGPPWFDPAFGESGGEDLDFLMRLRADGTHFAWAPRAEVREWVPPERARVGWVLRRMWRIGVTDMMVARKRRTGEGGRLMLAGRALGLLGGRTLALPAMLLPGVRRLDIAGQWVKALARLYALAGGGERLYGRKPASVRISAEALHDHVA